MNKRRVVITGMGLVSCLGQDVDLFYSRLLQGISGISLITEFPCEDYPTRFAGVVRDFDPELYLEKKQARRVDKSIAYAIGAGKSALIHGKLNTNTIGNLDKKRCGILIGSGIGGMGMFTDAAQTLSEKGQKRVSPFFIPYTLTNMSGAMLAMELGFMGPNYSISTACATSNNAIIAAAQHIQNDQADLILCGGTEAPILPIGMAGFCAVKALSQHNEEPTKASRPWDIHRDGFVMGEGAAVLILESLEHAIERGAPIFAEYLGGGLSCDAHHITEPRQDGIGVATCVEQALQNAGITPDQVNYINAHATSTPVGDMAEVNALKTVFHNGRNKIFLNATKSMIGHSLGAAGGMEAIVAVKAITDSIIHPTINLEEKEPDLDFHVPTKAEKLKVSVALSNSFGFGGHNATIVLAPYKVA